MFLQNGGASRWRVCYQRGIPRPVLFNVGGNVLFLYSNKQCNI